VCAQVRMKADDWKRELAEVALGIPPGDCHVALQTDVVKELVNKMAWVLGSVYRRNYSNMKTPTRAYAWRIVKRVIEDNGYPEKIGRDQQIK